MQQVGGLSQLATAMGGWRALISLAGQTVFSTLLVEGVRVGAKQVGLIGKDLQDPWQAEEALADIEELLHHPYTHLSNPNPALTPMEAAQGPLENIESLENLREQIYQRHPSLRPAGDRPKP